MRNKKQVAKPNKPPRKAWLTPAQRFSGARAPPPLAPRAPVRGAAWYVMQLASMTRRRGPQMWKIHRGGNAEQYNADKIQAVPVAVAKCADDTRKACASARRPSLGKQGGLVRGCSCRGTAGFAHASCLAEQAKILVAQAARPPCRVSAIIKSSRRVSPRLNHGLHAIDATPARWRGT